jgi:dTDP-4-amino-4,6-dideoxygalactose transaminase
MGIGAGDEVIVPCKTFIASASAVAMRGATPVIADVEINSQNITVETIEAKRTSNTKAIIAVHLAGWPCDMPEIMAYAKRHGLVVIEDCAQAHGAKIGDQMMGSFGDMAAFSFCQDKIMTTGGEGGMVVTNDASLWKHAWEFKDHGKSYDAVYLKQHPPGFRWLHERFGTNWRLTEMQSAIGRCQLRKLDEWVAKRAQYAQVYTDHVEALSCVVVPKTPEHYHHAFYKYYFQVVPEKLKSGWDRDRIMTALTEKGVPCFSGSCSEIYKEGAFSGLWDGVALPNAQVLEATSLMLLVHPTLDLESVEWMAGVVTSVLTEAEA